MIVVSLYTSLFQFISYTTHTHFVSSASMSKASLLFKRLVFNYDEVNHLYLDGPVKDKGQERRVIQSCVITSIPLLKQLAQDQSYNNNDFRRLCNLALVRLEALNTHGYDVIDPVLMENISLNSMRPLILKGWELFAPFQAIKEVIARAGEHVDDTKQFNLILNSIPEYIEFNIWNMNGAIEHSRVNSSAVIGMYIDPRAEHLFRRSEDILTTLKGRVQGRDSRDLYNSLLYYTSYDVGYIAKFATDATITTGATVFYDVCEIYAFLLTAQDMTLRADMVAGARGMVSYLRLEILLPIRCRYPTDEYLYRLDYNLELIIAQKTPFSSLTAAIQEIISFAAVQTPPVDMQMVTRRIFSVASALSTPKQDEDVTEFEMLDTEDMALSRTTTELQDVHIHKPRVVAPARGRPKKRREKRV